MEVKLTKFEKVMASVIVALLPALDILEQYIIPKLTDYGSTHPDVKWIGGTLTVLFAVKVLARFIVGTFGEKKPQPELPPPSP